MYQKSKNFKGKGWNRKLYRYGKYVTTINYQNELRNAREELVNVLYGIIDKKFEASWKESLTLLARMKKELDSLGTIPYEATKVMQYCVNIFDIASRYQDMFEDGELHICPEEKKEALVQFNHDLYFAGRHAVYDLRPDSVCGKIPYWNTTETGEPITMDNICFGPELGYPRKPASYWVKLSKKKKITLAQPMNFQKGTINKRVSLWATDALVKSGIRKFCQTASKALTQDLEALLDGEIF